MNEKNKIYKFMFKINDDAFQRLKSDFGLKKMCGNTCGISDEITGIIISVIDNENDEVNIELK